MTSDIHKTPKKYFLTKLYSALQEFEDITGTEIYNIKINRTPIEDDEIIKKFHQKYTFEWDLEIH